MFFRHESQSKNTMQKDEIGFSTTIENKLQFELGAVYRIGRRFLKSTPKLMSESLVPILRMRLKSSQSVGIELGYSYDFNISKLENINTISTNEININFYFLKRKASICPGNSKW